MIQKALISCIACILCITGPSVAQDHWQASDSSVARNLRSLAIELGGDQYFERMIPLGYVSSPEKSDITRPLWFRKENTYVYIKLSFDTTKVVESKNYVIGKAFFSERYQEKDYRALSKSGADITRDGINMFCKLYYDRKSMEFRLNIYPDIIVDVCRAGMHGNKKVCKPSEANQRTAFYVHDSLACRLLSQPDSYYSDFLYSKTTRERKFNYQKSPELYYIKNQKNYFSDDDSFRAKYNYKKHIKNFSVIKKDNLSKEIKLVLQFTKYPKSDDFIENNSYEFINKKIESSVADTSWYLTDNSWNRALVESDYPDDVVINELNSDYSNWYYLDGTEKIYSDGRINARNLKLAKARDNLKEITERLTSNMTEYSALKKEISIVAKVDSTLSISRDHTKKEVDVLGKRLARLLTSMDSEIKKMNSGFLKNDSIIANPVPTLKLAEIIKNETRTINDTIFILADTLPDKIARFSGLFERDHLKMFGSERSLHDSIASTKAELASCLAESDNIAQQISDNNAKRVRLLADTVANISGRDKLKEAQMKVEEEERGLSQTAQGTSLRNEKWIYLGRWPSSDAAELNATPLDENTFNRFLFANYNTKIAVRDSLPEQVGKYYYRGGVIGTIEILYGKYNENAKTSEKVKSRRYPRPGSQKREDLHNYFLYWRLREHNDREEKPRTLKLAGNNDVEAICFKPLSYKPIEAKGYIYLWVKVEFADN